MSAPTLQLKPFVRPPIVNELNLDSYSPGMTHRLRMVMTENATGNETLVPVFVQRAEAPGPVVGVTAAIHGNELNGIPVVHRLLEAIPPERLRCGTLIAVPILNIPGYVNQKREYEDGQDLNRIMPGREKGDNGKLYAHRVMDRIIRHFEYLIDLHTASFGRVNSLYVRADMEDPVTAKMARRISPQIIVHNQGADGTLRSAAAERGIHAITVEVGDPQRFQHGLVRSTRLGIQEILENLSMIDDLEDPEPSKIIECRRSYWLYTDRGGILEVQPDVVDRVEQGQLVARLYNVWGDLVREYTAPESGVVVGKSINPSAHAGSRIIHLGIT